MPCQPCEGDGNVSVDRDHVYLRFIGGRNKVGKARGSWRTHVTGRIYRTLPDDANFDAYPYWAPSTEEEFCLQEETRAKAEDEAVDSTSSEKDDVASSEEPESDISVSSGPGLSEELGGGISEEALIRGMDDNLLKKYIADNGGKVDGRWGREKLIQEALKL